MSKLVAITESWCNESSEIHLDDYMTDNLGTYSPSININTINELGIEDSLWELFDKLLLVLFTDLLAKAFEIISYHTVW